MAIFTMPIFCLFVLLIIGFIWLLSSAAYKPIGRLANKILNKAKDNMSEKKTEETKEIHL